MYQREISLEELIWEIKTALDIFGPLNIYNIAKRIEIRDIQTSESSIKEALNLLEKLALVRKTTALTNEELFISN